MRGWTSFAIGASAGALVGLGVWWFAARKLDASLAEGSGQLAARLGMGQRELNAQLEAGRQQLRIEVIRQVNAQLPNAVRTSMTSTLNEYGITPATGQRVATVLDYADRIGII